MGVLNNRIALITGSSRGIGRAIAEKYIDEGAHVIAVARTIGALEELDDYAKSKGGNVTIVPLDLTDFIKIDELGFALYNRFGRIDILVGNAGLLGGLSPVGHISPPNWQKVIDLNLTANWRLIRSMDPLLRQSKAGRAIFVTSRLAKEPRAFYSAYAASKAGIIGFSKSVALELGSRNIRCNVIAPGFIETEMTAALDPKTVDGWREGIPLKRGGTTDDVANATVFLASDMSAYITGQTLYVCGGMLT